MAIFHKVIPLQVCIFLCLLVQPAPSTAQQNFSVEHYTAENGLPQNSIKSIAADAEGFIWLATEDGLTRFDGRKFEVFEHNATGVGTRRVISILPGQRNPVHNGRLNVLYAFFASDEMCKISNGRAMPVGNDLQLQKRRMDALRAGKKDIYYISGLPERWARTMLPELPSLITDNYADGHFFLCDRDKVAYYRQWEKQYEIPNYAPERLNYFTLGKRLYYFDGKQTFVQISHNQRISFPAKGDIVRNEHFANQKSQIKIYWNNNSDQAFFYLNGQLFELVPEPDGSLTTHLLTSGFDLLSESIDVIFYDRANKKVFLGSSTNGLFVISIPQFETIRVSGADRPNIFYAQVPYDDHSVLTPAGIIAGKDARTGEIVDRRLPAVEQLHTGDRRFIFKDRQGNTWATSGYTLTRFDRNNRIIASWKFRNGVKAICQRNEREFWIGVYEMGIFKLDTQNPSSEPEFAGGEPARHITCMGFRNAGELWIGTLNGLYIFNTQNRQTRLVPGTSGFYVKSIQPDSQGRSWMTVLDKGLILLHSEKKLVTFPLDEHGFLGSAHYAFNDGGGFLWVPTNRGLFQIKVSDLLAYAGGRTAGQRPFYAYHSMNEGFKTNEFNGGCNSCGLKLANGYVSLPSLDGLVWFRPEHISPSVPDGGIVLDGAFINRSQIGLSGDTVDLPLKPENIRFDFATAYFGNNYNLHLSYALLRKGEKASHSDWQPIDDDNGITVRYSSLNPGRYVLLVRKEAGFGMNNAVIREIHIVVPEVWYETSWAMLAFAASFMMLLIVGVRVYNKYRLKTIQNEKAELEKLVRMRTSTLEKTLTELDEQVHIMSRMIASISHDVQTPLNQIAVASEDIPDLVSENRFEDVSKVATMIASVSGRTGKMLNDLLNYIKIQVYGKRVRFETLNLHDLIGEKIELFEGAIKRQENTVTVDVPKKLTVKSDYQLLSIVIHNLMDNAVKYTRRGRIAFRVYVSDERVELVLVNSGKSLPREKMDFINNLPPDDGLSATPHYEKGSNLGLIIVKEVSQLIGIKIHVTQTDTVNFHILFEHLK